MGVQFIIQIYITYIYVACIYINTYMLMKALLLKVKCMDHLHLVKIRIRFNRSGDDLPGTVDVAGLGTTF